MQTLALVCMAALVLLTTNTWGLPGTDSTLKFGTISPAEVEKRVEGRPSQTPPLPLLLLTCSRPCASLRKVFSDAASLLHDIVLPRVVAADSVAAAAALPHAQIDLVGAPREEGRPTHVVYSAQTEEGVLGSGKALAAAVLGALNPPRNVHILPLDQIHHMVMEHPFGRPSAGKLALFLTSRAHVPAPVWRLAARHLDAISFVVALDVDLAASIDIDALDSDALAAYNKGAELRSSLTSTALTLLKSSFGIVSLPDLIVVHARNGRVPVWSRFVPETHESGKPYVSERGLQIWLKEQLARSSSGHPAASAAEAAEASSSSSSLRTAPAEKNKMVSYASVGGIQRVVDDAGLRLACGSGPCMVYAMSLFAQTAATVRSDLVPDADWGAYSAAMAAPRKTHVPVHSHLMAGLEAAVKSSLEKEGQASLVPSVWVDAHDVPQFMATFGVLPEDLPAVLILDAPRTRFWVYDDAFHIDSIVSWVTAVWRTHFGPANTHDSPAGEAAVDLPELDPAFKNIHLRALRFSLRRR